MSGSPPSPVEMALRDGTSVIIRPVGPDDKELLAEGLTRLSRESRYRRFMAPIQGLSTRQLRYLTEIDYDNHMAWAAIDPADGRGLGIARYHRLADEPEVAEAAVAVVDSHHGRGLGTLLLEVLGRSAVANGIRTFRGYVLQENTPMLRILEELGAELHPEDHTTLRVDVPVAARADALPETPSGRLFRAVARRLAPALAVRFLHDDVFERAVELFASRRRGGHHSPGGAAAGDGAARGDGGDAATGGGRGTAADDGAGAPAGDGGGTAADDGGGAAAGDGGDAAGAKGENPS